MSIRLVMELPPTSSLPANGPARIVAENSVRGIFSPSFLTMLMLTKQYAAKDQCSQEK
jgi:hypothetical protein